MILLYEKITSYGCLCERCVSLRGTRFSRRDAEVAARITQHQKLRPLSFL
jgi:hypothetical protein